MGFTVERNDRFKLGIVERLAARKPDVAWRAHLDAASGCWYAPGPSCAGTAT
jgi:hypothetical protein